MLQSLYSVLLDPKTAWTGPVIIVVFVFLTPLFLYLSHRNKFTRDVIKHGWVPIIAAMAISRCVGKLCSYVKADAIYMP